MYHELGHVAHNDTMYEIMVEEDMAKLDDLIHDSAFKANAETVNRYFARGIKVVPRLNNTTLGNYLSMLLKLS